MARLQGLLCYSTMTALLSFLGVFCKMFQLMTNGFDCTLCSCPLCYQPQQSGICLLVDTSFRPPIKALSRQTLGGGILWFTFL